MLTALKLEAVFLQSSYIACMTG